MSLILLYLKMNERKKERERERGKEGVRKGRKKEGEPQTDVSESIPELTF